MMQDEALTIGRKAMTHFVREFPDVGLSLAQGLRLQAIVHDLVLEFIRPKKFNAQQIDYIINAVSELPDRNSPKDWPEAMLVTVGELTSILEDHLVYQTDCEEELEKALSNLHSAVDQAMGDTDSMEGGSPLEEAMSKAAALLPVPR